MTKTDQHDSSSITSQYKRRRLSSHRFTVSSPNTSRVSTIDSPKRAPLPSFVHDTFERYLSWSAQAGFAPHAPSASSRLVAFSCKLRRLLAAQRAT